MAAGSGAGRRKLTRLPLNGTRRAQVSLLSDGRLHLNDGPIDLVIEAVGETHRRKAAYAAASHRFVEVLDELCRELDMLRAPARVKGTMPCGPIARRMVAAVQPYAGHMFITPMAAVAGSVAEEILAVMTGAAQLRRASVNNGGDIALHLADGEHFRVGMVSGIPPPSDGVHLSGLFSIASRDRPRGIATSGWQGRSFSLGIADAVTVLARTASMADAAATVIANAVDLPGHPAVLRVPAGELVPDSDLGPLPVTRHVGELSPKEIESALRRGQAIAEQCRSVGLIEAAVLSLQGSISVVQPGRPVLGGTIIGGLCSRSRPGVQHV
jgi:ApbE superfamily uncharacterized protein (UPF0280 family)